MKRAGWTELHRAVALLQRAIPGIRWPRKHDQRQSAALRRDLASIRKWWSPNIAGFGIGRKHCERNGREMKKLVIRFYLHRKVDHTRVANPEKIIPERITLESLGLAVGTDVRQVHGMPKFHFLLNAGDEVGHFSGEAGTAGLFVHRAGDTADFLLSCAHVLAPPPDARLNPPDAIESPVDKDSTRAINQVGEIEDFFRLSSGAMSAADAAIARIDAGISVSNDIDGLAAPSSLMDAAESLVGRTVFQRGAVTGRAVSGIAREMGCSVKFLFRGGTFTVSNLVRYDIESRPGDSGAVVLDENNRAVGIHVGAEDSSSSAYFSPMNVIVDQFNIVL